MTSTNPLLDFARKVELSIKLPSNGNWYEEGTIDYTLGGEVEIYPMLPKDELALMNPDGLLSGQSNVSLIKSCVPAVKNPEKLLYPDLNVLLLAIQKATYGNKLTMQVVCPECLRKVNEKAAELEEQNKDKKKEEQVDIKAAIAEMEKKGEIMIHQQENDFDIDYLLAQIQYLEPEYIYKTDNGLKIYLRPNTLEDKSKYGLMQFNQEKIIKAYKEYSFEKSVSDDDMKKIASNITDSYMNINDIGNQLITAAILNIELPDGSFVDNKDMILEFISQTPSNIVSELNDKIHELNNIGLPKELDYECECCHHQWKDTFFGFNQTDFFGIGS